MAIILLDNDGTLVGGKANNNNYNSAMQEAISKKFGIRPDVDLDKYHGFTDMLVMKDILTKAQVGYDMPTLWECISLFGNLYPQRPEGLKAIPGVPETIPLLARKHNLGLLTGNVEKMARKKLGVCFDTKGRPLGDYFLFGGFGGTDMHNVREDLFPIALHKAQQLGYTVRGNVYLVDDAPRGLAAAVKAQALLTPDRGFYVPTKIIPIGITTGIYHDPEELKAVRGVSHVISNMRELPSLVDRLELMAAFNI
jgi:phosphoglycolate phosphatase-like HAD superfamily hydrolase